MQDCLLSLVTIYIKNDILNQLDLTKIVKKFSEEKQEEINLTKVSRIKIYVLLFFMKHECNKSWCDIFSKNKLYMWKDISVLIISVHIMRRNAHWLN